MKIAVWHNLPSGGGKRALYYHVRGLVERGHTVESWCPPTADRTYLPLNELIPEHIIPLSWSPRQAKTSFAQLTEDYFNIVSKLKAIDWHCRQCAEEINAGGFDLLFANSCQFFYNTPIARYIKIPKIIYLGEPYRPLYEASPKLPWLAFPPPPRKKALLSLRYYRNWLQDFIKIQGLRVQMREELLNAQAFDTILVNSRFSRESVLRAYGLDAKVCYLGIDTELFRPLGLPRENFVIGLGGIDIGKGIDRAIEALGTIKKTERPYLVWVGNYSNIFYQSNYEQLAKKLEVKFIIKVGIPDRELVHLLNRATVMIYTSRLEPFGFAPLEANACGTPVVAIAEGGVRETIRDKINGLLANDSDPILLSQAILKFIENPVLVQEIGEKARKYVLENWTLKLALDRLEKYFEDLTRSR